MEETERVGKIRLEAAECLEKILNECKQMKTDRANCVKMVCSKKLFFAVLFSENGTIVGSRDVFKFCFLGRVMVTIDFSS